MNINENFIDNTPAYQRRKKCEGCGETFFQKEPEQKMCAECWKEAITWSHINDSDDSDEPEDWGTDYDWNDLVEKERLIGIV